MKIETHRLQRRRIVATLLAAFMFATVVGGVVAAAPSGAEAHGQNHRGECPDFQSWQDWVGGFRQNAKVSFVAVNICRDRHTAQAYVRITRSGWSCRDIDSGRKWTNAAGHSHEGHVRRSVHATMTDGPLPGCTLRTFHGRNIFV